ncbi:hypothetical protein [Neolewinella agarilytica]|uniref:Cytochrome c domain-containing protein n=1 Tax=Neolewinella agarilytica TaxID=478744 RepID=A0A1H9H3R6_9BACT|nr:hypothetical protein [Neolewinella agarilytica]SEQ56981.1 hypothetical protein SAMN05444359_1125 [Neolewinella agarilytica]
MKKHLLLLCLILPLVGCYYDSEELLYGTTECATENVTYSADVLPLIVDNCYGCHDASSNFGGVTLEGYDRLRTYVDNGELLGAIRHTPGFSPMPKNEPQLVECNIEKIAAWVAAGAPND